MTRKHNLRRKHQIVVCFDDEELAHLIRKAEQLTDGNRSRLIREAVCGDMAKSGKKEGEK